ncbi:hypothetical protein C0Q70_07247 [Pomacea canaliculata]|uniref:Uncharacterized protein n=1 Tax=Pomacea canaliculata TaxID=400727 RepID=A0A2T7PEH8_POMCA|nr:hypothetical protein C0Q70_07247 [Pomacea canaliculata]
MANDRKYGPSKPKKRKFCGNRYSKEKATVGKSIRSAFSNICYIGNSTVSSESYCEQVDTPTRSEQKLQDLYELVFDCSSEGEYEEADCENDTSESEEDSTTLDIVVENPKGNRIIDVAILNDDPGQFCCTFCEEADVERLKNAQRQARLASKALRQARRRRRLGADEQEAERDGHPNQPGGY